MKVFFDDWLKDFTKSKREVAAPGSDSQYGIHSVRRFIDQSGDVFEIAITYTDRLVSRKGTICSDGITIQWGDWNTEHDVEVP